MMYLEETFEEVKRASSQRREYVRCRVVIDASGVSFTHYRQGAQLLQLIAKTAQMHFPELIHSITIVNAPAVFAYIWGVVKWVFNERIQKKISICSANFEEELLRLQIDRSQLPACLG